MRKDYIVAFLLTVVAIVGLAAGILLVRQSQEIRERAQVTSDILVSLSPASQTTNSGGKITVSVNLTNRSSPGRDINLQAAEFTLSFDSTSFSAGNLTCNASFLASTASSNVSGNSIYLACFAPGGSGAKTVGSGATQTLGTFELTALSNEGTSAVNVASAVVSENDVELSGGGGVGGSYTISGVGGATDNPNPTGTATAAPTGQPNACGGTCGSNSNCQSGLTCYQGFCRNPSCTTKTNCVCSTATPKPKGTGKATVKPTATATATPEVITVVETPTASPTPELASGEENKGALAKYIAIGAGILALIIALILLLKKLFGKKDNPPQVSPPVPPQTGVQTPPPVNMMPPVNPMASNIPPTPPISNTPVAPQMENQGIPPTPPQNPPIS